MPALLGLLLLLAVSPAPASAGDFLTLAATTSTRDSGLLDHLLPRFQSRTGIEVRVIAVGSGRALELGRRGDVDVILAHDRTAEDRFLAAGHAGLRRDVMWNDFVLIGPASDPARVRDRPGIVEALRAIAEAERPFLSRGDASGTHAAELRCWAAAGIPVAASARGWYRETGSGQGATLHVASQLDSYLLADRATWRSFRSPGTLRILLEGDPLLHNPYGALLVSSARHPRAKEALGRQLVDWLVSPEGQAAIGAFPSTDDPLFHPNVRPSAPQTPSGDDPA